MNGEIRRWALSVCSSMAAALIFVAVTAYLAGADWTIPAVAAGILLAAVLVLITTAPRDSVKMDVSKEPPPDGRCPCGDPDCPMIEDMRRPDNWFGR